MRTLNVRLVVILLVGVTVLAGAVWGVHRIQVGRNAKHHLTMAEKKEERAELAREKKNLRTAVEEYGKALEDLTWYVNYRPADLDALERLAMLQADLALDPELMQELQQRNPTVFGLSFSNLEKLLRRDPSRTAARRRLVDVYLAFLRFSDAETHVAEFPEELRNDGESLEILGTCRARSVKYQEAVEALRRAVEVAPEQVRAYALLAVLLQNHLKNPTEADQWMTRLLQSNPDSSRAQLLYAQHAAGLLNVNTLSDARKHPLLMEVMVPGVFQSVVDHAVAGLDLANDDPDASVLADKQEVLAAAVRRAVEVVDADLPLDEPDTLLLKAMQGTPRMRTADAIEAKASAAKDEVLEAMKSELAPDDYNALLVAAKHEVLVAATKRALQMLASPNHLIDRAKWAVLDKVLKHAVRARELAEEGRDALSSDENRKESGELSAAEGVLGDALKGLLESGDAPLALTLGKNRAVLRAAIDGAIEARDLSDADRKALSLAAQRGILVDALKSALRARQLAPADRNTLLNDEQGATVLARIVARALKDRVLELESDDAQARLQTHQAHLRKGEFDEAREYVQDGIKAYPKNVFMYAAVADLELFLGRRRRAELEPQREKAIACLQQGLKETDDHDHAYLLWKLSGILLDSGRVEPAQQAVKKLGAIPYATSRAVPIPPRTAAVAFLNARIALAQQQWLAAIEGFERARPGLANFREPQVQADLFLADCYRHLGNVDKQLEAFRRVLGSDPFNHLALAGLTEVALQSGRFDEGIEQYRNLIKLARLSPASQIHFLQLLVRQNLQLDPGRRDWREVETRLDQVAKAAPDLIQVQILRAEMLMGQNREEDAEKVLLQVRDKNPKEVTPWIALASLAQNSQEWDRVEALLEEAEQELGDLLALRLARARYLVKRYGKQGPARLMELATNTEHFSHEELWKLLVGLGSLAQSQEDWGQVESFLDVAKRKLGDTVSLRSARARYFVSRYREESADRLRELAKDTESFSEADRLRLWHSLLSLAVRINDREQSKLLGQMVLEKMPNDFNVRLMLFESAIRANDNEGMGEMLDEIQKVEGEGPMWNYGQAARLTMQCTDPNDKRLDEARRLLDQAREQRPSWPKLPLLAGTIHYKQGDHEAALEEYLKAFKLGDRNPVAIRRAVQLLGQRGRNDKAVELIALLEGQKTRFSGEFEAFRIRSLAQKAEYAEALELARNAFAESEDYQDHVLLGYLLGRVGNQAKADGETVKSEKLLAEAERALRHAVQLSDELLETWTALIRLLAETQQNEAAEEAIQQALSKIPADQAPLAVAGWHELLGRRLQAQQEYEAALAANPRDPVTVRAATAFYLRAGESLAAQRLLKRILDGTAEVNQEYGNWARRRMASILVQRGSYRNAQEAIGLLEKNVASTAVTAADKRMLAELLPSERRSEAIGMLQGLGTAAEPGDRLQLAILYKADGSWPKAREEMTRLLGSHGDNPQYVVTYVEWLLGQGLLDEADRWLKKLERLAAHHFRTVRFRADWCCQRKQFDQALKLLTDFVEESQAVPSRKGDRLLLVAQMLEHYIPQVTKSGREDMAQQYALVAETSLRTYVLQRPGQEMLLAAFLARQGRIGSALKEIESAWNRSDNAVTLAQALSAVLKSSAAGPQEIQQAMKFLEAALAKHDRATGLLLVGGDVSAHRGDYDQAEVAYRDILVLERDNVVAMNNLAVLLALRQIKLDEAMELINRAISMAGPVAAMLDSRASVHMAQGQIDEALADLNSGIAKAPSAVKYFHRAQAYDLAGDKTEAGKSMQRAVELGIGVQMIHPLEVATYQKLLKLVN